MGDFFCVYQTTRTCTQGLFLHTILTQSFFVLISTEYFMSHPLATAHSTPSSIQRILTLPPWLFQFVADVIATSAGFALYYFMRFRTGWFSALLHPDYLPAMPVEVPGTSITLGTMAIPYQMMLTMTIYWTLLFWLAGMYKNWFIRSPFDEAFSLVRISFYGCLLLMLVIYFDDDFKRAGISRLIIVLYWIFMALLLIAGRSLARALQRRLRRRGIIRIPALVIGDAERVADVLTSLKHFRWYGYRVQGVVLHNEAEIASWQQNTQEFSYAPVLGILPQLQDIIREYKPTEAIIALRHHNHDELLGIAWECETMDINVKIQPDLYDIFMGQARTFQLYGVPLIEISTQLMKPWEAIAKRLLDIALSGCAMLFGLPLYLIIGCAVRFTSPGPIFYGQERSGKDGKTFKMWKFRSMRTDAEKLGPQWAKMNDPRVTPIGRFLRKSHLDEIPQFWNIFVGHMSVVGPRPERPMFVEKFTQEVPYYSRRLKVRPGLTGWWQVQNDGYEDSLDEVRDRLKFDFYYIENMSFRLDIEIILRTVVKVFQGKGQG